jgi:hypothetical protein
MRPRRTWRTGNGVLGAAEPVDAPDHRAEHVEGAPGLAGFGAFGQVRAERERDGPECQDAAVRAPAFPLAPDVAVDGAGGLALGCGAAAMRAASRSVAAFEPSTSWHKSPDARPAESRRDELISVAEV